MKKNNLIFSFIVICALMNISCGNPKPKEAEMTNQPGINYIELKKQKEGVQNANNNVPAENNSKNEALKNNQEQEKQLRNNLESLTRKESEVTLGYMNLTFDFNIAVSMMNEIYIKRNELIEQGKQLNYCCIESIERMNRQNREYIERWKMSQ
jgi:hypothetical protein